MLISLHAVAALKIKISCESLSFSKDGATKTCFTHLPETTNIPDGIYKQWLSDTEHQECQTGITQGEETNKVNPTISLENFQVGAQPGGLPELRRWSQVSREANVARVCKAETSGGESCRERGRTLKRCIGFPLSLQLNSDQCTCMRKPKKIKGKNPW